MKTNLLRPTVLAALVLVATTGCRVSTEGLKTLSAGHTGCSPDQITISNRTETGGFLKTGQMWNATCNGKVYLCSGVPEREFSCAPVAK
jgi:hypothetical protein